MWQIAVKLVNGETRYVPLTGKTGDDAPGELRDFVSGEGNYAEPWVETTDGRFVQRSQVIEAWLYEGLPTTEYRDS